MSRNEALSTSGSHTRLYFQNFGAAIIVHSEKLQKVDMSLDFGFEF